MGAVGRPRTGKTFLITFFGLMDVMFNRFRLVGNYKIDYERYSRISPYDLLVMLEKGRVDEHVCIVTHEVHNWLDSYISMTKRSRGEQAFVTQALKFGYSWFWDSQRLTKADSNLRDNTPDIFYCQKKSGYFLYTLISPLHRDSVVLTNRCFRVPFGLASRFWDRYNTYEGSLPLDYTELVLEMEKTVPSLMRKRVLHQVSLLYGKRVLYGLDSFKAVNRDSVGYALLMEGEPVGFKGYVVQGLRRRLMGS